MQTIQAKLFDLKIDPANVRKTDMAPSDTMIASIRSKGIIEALTVRKNNAGGYFVTNGSKRLAAMHILHRDGEWDKSKPIECKLHDMDDVAAADISLTLNFARDDMHPVDEYEAMKTLIDGGKTPEAIAAEYGLPLKRVNQSLALGRLCPEVLAAWREGKLREDAAAAFTLETDHARQAAILKKLGRHGLGPYGIRQEIIGEAHEAAGLLKLVGLDAYKAAGGATTEDLFSEAKKSEVIATDIKLLKKLAEKKIEETVQRLQSEGWKWVSPMSSLPHSAHYWDHKAKSSIKAEDRKDYGVILNRQHNGDLEIRYGVQKPSAAKAADTKKKNAKAEIPVISAALCGRISQQITDAAEAVLATDHKLALAVAVAVILAEDGPAKITAEGGSDEYLTFDEALAQMRKKDINQLLAILAGQVARSLDLGGSYNQNSLPLAEGNDDDSALLHALNQKQINCELRERFNAADYFGGVTAQACSDAIAACDPKYPFTGKEKKSDLAKLAAELVTKSNAAGKAGYLPPEMRLKSYDGPTSKPAKPAAAQPAKKVAKKAPAKKKAA